MPVDNANKPYFLPLDLSSESPDNFVDGEVQQIASYQRTIVKPLYGRYYGDTLRVFTLNQSGSFVELSKDVDFDPAEVDSYHTRLSGKPVYKAIIIRTTDVSGFISLSYQAVGGSNQADGVSAYRDTQAVLAGEAGYPFSQLGAVPDTFQPYAHQHDVRDIYGFESIVQNLFELTTVIGIINQGLGTTKISLKDRQIAQRLSDFKAALKLANRQAIAAIDDHMAGTAHQHNYTKASVGLGLVSNYAFVAMNDGGGQPLPIYAHPLSLKQVLQSPPPATTHNHIGRTDNPHGVDAESLGLGLVVNHPIAINYALNAQQYNTLFTEATVRYLSPFVLKNAVTEAQAAQVAQHLTSQVGFYTDPASGAVPALRNNVQTSLTSVQNKLTNIQTVVSDTQTLLSEISTTRRRNLKYRIVNGNRPYAEGLKQLLALDHASRADGFSVGKDGLWPLPPQVQNLYLWLDVDFEGNTVREDSTGKERLTALVDRSSYQRLFVSNSLTTAPVIKDSKDVIEGKIGVTRGKVADFEPGHHLNQISGQAVTLQPGMTIFVVVRNQAAGIRFDVLSDTSPTPKARIATQSVGNRAIVAETTVGWTPLRAPVNSSYPNTSNVLVASIGEASYFENWLASTKPVNVQANPRGVDELNITWPPTDFQSAPMPRIGNDDAAVACGGELSQVIIYNRQLSVAECEAVVEYLKLAKSSNQGLGVDFSAKNAF